MLREVAEALDHEGDMLDLGNKHIGDGGAAALAAALLVIHRSNAAAVDWCMRRAPTRRIRSFICAASSIFEAHAKNALAMS